MQNQRMPKQIATATMQKTFRMDEAEDGSKQSQRVKRLTWRQQTVSDHWTYKEFVGPTSSFMGLPQCTPEANLTSLKLN